MSLIVCRNQGYMNQEMFSLATASRSCPPSRMELTRLQFSPADRQRNAC